MLNTTTEIYRAFFSELEKMAEIMPQEADHIKRTAGSPVPRGPRLPTGGRVGTTTATPFSGNKAKIANVGLAAAAGGLGLGVGAMGMTAAKHLKEPIKDIIHEEDAEGRLSVPIREPRRPSMLQSSALGPFLPKRLRPNPTSGY